jgi:hypothetical protein
MVMKIKAEHSSIEMYSRKRAVMKIGGIVDDTQDMFKKTAVHSLLCLYMYAST